MPIVPGIYGDDGNGERIRSRRATMRAVARTVFAERGYAGVHVRDLAKRCGVSAQTLYNNLGGREEILCAAVEELLRAQLVHAGEISQRNGCNYLLAFCSLTSRLMELDREYVRAIISIVVDNKSRPTLADRIDRRCVEAYCRQLSSMQCAGTLKHWVNVTTLATTLQNTICSVLAEHAGKASDAQQTCDDLTMRVGLLLLGVARNEEAARIEAAIRRAQGTTIQT